MRYPGRTLERPPGYLFAFDVDGSLLLRIERNGDDEGQSVGFAVASDVIPSWGYGEGGIGSECEDRGIRGIEGPDRCGELRLRVEQAGKYLRCGVVCDAGGVGYAACRVVGVE